MPLKLNLDAVDRIARFIVGMACIYIGLIGHSLVNNTIVPVLVGLFGVINLGVVIFAHYPVYSIAGICTYSDKKRYSHF